MRQDRTSPDDILRLINQKENTRGKLKIFFGYAAGVGKTYSMLENAHSEKENGADVVCGYIEPHTRPHTLNLLEGLEVLPPLEVSHKSITLKEFDLDAALKRHPDIVLVDELAHTNAPGLRHPKRYQDINELLEAGINVYTTVNVQHIESLNDIVASITGVIVNERIPDSVFDGADRVELVDIEPDELIKRLNNGYIYRPEQAKRAVTNFFSVTNLTALREIALRRTADHVNRLSEKEKQLNGSEYYTNEHILVCLSSSPTNAKIIRTATRLANAFKCKFTALFVETKNFENMSDDDKAKLRDNINLAKRLGANLQTVYGDDIALQIAEFARLWGVSKIVVGRSSTKRKFGFGTMSFSEKISFYAPNLDIYVIPDAKTPNYYKKPKQKIGFRLSGSDIVISLGILILFTGIGKIFDMCNFNESNIIMMYLLGVLITALTTTNRFYSIASSVLSVLVFNFFFTEPTLSLTAYASGYPATFAIMFACAFLISSLASKIKKHARLSAQMAYRTKILLETNQILQQENCKSDIINVTVKQIMKLIKKDIVYYDIDGERLAAPTVYLVDKNKHSSGDQYVSKNEQAVAAWVHKNNKHAGATTSTLGDSKCLYLAVRAANKVYGVIGIPLQNEVLDTFENGLLLSMIGELALALEKEAANTEREKANLKAKNEGLRANLLRAISHDLRTPLTGISGNASILMNNENEIDESKRKHLYTDIYDDSMWLINLVENMLSVTRLEDGSMNLHLQAELIDEVITESLCHINRNSKLHKINIINSGDYLMAKMDARLIVQVIINIIDNAIKYTPQNSEITISTKSSNNMIVIEIADNGTGISDEMKERVFDMFYTGEHKIVDSRRSLGLGLALCKSIINAHGGNISVHDNMPNGAVFKFTLPREEIKLHE